MRTPARNPLRPFAATLAMLLIAGCGGGGGGGGGGPPPPALDISAAAPPNGVVGVAYSHTIAVTGGTGARNFTISAGALPAGLSLGAATGAITGTPTGPASTTNFTITVTDSGTPQQTDAQALALQIVNPAGPGRNDTIATATTLPLGNATFSASISPSGQPNTVFAPDQDYYRITTPGPLRVAIDINAQVNGSPIDSVIEFVDANGVRLNTCVAPAFASPCESDDEVLGVQLDSFLEIQITAPLGATFYLHVVDFRGDARPDLLYDMVMSLSN